MYPDTKIIPFGIINKMFVWRKDKIMGRDLQGRVAIVTVALVWELRRSFLRKGLR